jgi:histidyl-tRNA synthetase
VNNPALKSRSQAFIKRPGSPFAHPPECLPLPLPIQLNMGKAAISIPKGTRDFLPEEMQRRKHIFNTIEGVYQKYGFLPIETPAMEQMTTLTGKYGDEGDKLLFRILNSGDFLSKADPALLEAKDARGLAPQIAEKGLRYDLTVPFARFVVQHRNELTFPFRRYQIQPVWRADRPQKGRYREFYQCDADIIGSDSLLNEAELIQMIDEVFKKLGIGVHIKLNNRKILAGIAEYLGKPEKLNDLTMALDKMDKVGTEGVVTELMARGFLKEEVARLLPLLAVDGSNAEKIDKLGAFLKESTLGTQGVEELSLVFRYLEGSIPKEVLQADFHLARGLDYYTGTIMEVVATDFEMGSLCGGGRYDDLTGVFGFPGLSGVGMSFGADRIYDVMMGLNLFSTQIRTASRLMFVNFGGEEEMESLRWLRQIREEGIASEIYPDQAKVKKQMAYANALHIARVAFMGEEERAQGLVKLKEMESGEERLLALPEIITLLKQ